MAPKEIPTTRFNFELPVELYDDLKKIALKSGRSGAADILRQLASEYVQWWRHGRSTRRKPSWSKEKRKQSKSKQARSSALPPEER